METGLILAGSHLRLLGQFKKGTRVALPAAFYGHGSASSIGKFRPLTAGIATSFVGEPGYPSWSDIRGMVDNDVQIASAGHFHANLVFRNALLSENHYDVEIRDEIYTSKQRLEQHLGRKINGFIYPFGFYDTSIKRLVRKAGYEWALTGTQGLNTSETDPYELKRIDVEFDDTPSTVRQKIKGTFRLRLARYPSISVIIPTYNRKRLLEPVLRSLIDQNYPKDKFEIIVADDGGSDGSDALVKRLGKESGVKLRYFWQEDKGFRAGTARNLGARHAKGELLLFLDGDVVGHPDLLLHHARFYTHWPERIVLGYVCAHTCLNVYNVPGVIQAVEDKTLRELPLQPELRDTIYSRCLGDLDRYRQYWTAFFSNNISFAKGIFERVGRFDDSFRGWGIEDNEIGYRLAQAGYKFIVNRRAVGFHIGTEGELLNPYLSPDERKFKALTNNMRRFYKKYPHQDVKRFLVGLNTMVPEKHRLFKDDPATHAVGVGGKCNNACIVCNQLGKKKEFRPTQEIKEELESFANRNTVWFRGGEPTLREDFFDIIGFAKYIGFKEIGVQTNGRAFAYRDFAEKAVNWGATHFEIQLYGDTAEAHDAVTRTPGSFEQTTRGIRNLRELHATVLVNVVLCEQNRHCEKTLLSFANTLGATTVRTVLTAWEQKGGRVSKSVKPQTMPKEAGKKSTTFEKQRKRVQAKLTSSDFERAKGALLDTIDVGPKKVLVCVTQRCNTNCGFCPHHNDTYRRSPGYSPSKKIEIPLDKFMEVIEDLGVMGTKDLGILGDGEPLMHPDIITMIQAAKKKNLVVVVFTNGLLLNKRMAEALCKAGLDSILVNLSAGSREVYGKLHPGRAADFDKLVANLQYLSKLKKEKGWKLGLTLVQVISRINYTEIPLMIHLAKRIGADATIFKPYIFYGKPEEMSKDPFIMRKSDLDEFRQMIPQVEEQIRLSGNPFTFQEIKDAFLRSDQNLYTDRVYEEIPCLIGWYLSQIGTDGRVTPCCMLTTTMGNINEQRFRDIWFSEIYHSFRTKTREGSFPRSTDVCQRCENYRDNKEFFDTLAPIREEVYRTHPKPRTLI